MILTWKFPPIFTALPSILLVIYSLPVTEVPREPYEQSCRTKTGGSSKQSSSSEHQRQDQRDLFGDSGGLSEHQAVSQSNSVVDGGSGWLEKVIIWSFALCVKLTFFL